MPESVTDRPTKSHEYVFLLSKSARYYYDAESIKEPATDTGRVNGRDGRDEHPDARPPGSSPRTLARIDYTSLGRNRRSVWSITTEPFPGAHFATFPTELPRLCILAGCPEGGTVLDPFAGAIGGSTPPGSTTRAGSSVDRASGSEPEGRRFNPCPAHHPTARPRTSRARAQDLDPAYRKRDHPP